MKSNRLAAHICARKNRMSDLASNLLPGPRLGKSAGLNATYHFTFTGQEEIKATVVIRDQKLAVSNGHLGVADFRLSADSQTWLRFLRKEANLVWALLRRKIRIHGSPRLLLAFARCFPS